MWNISQSCYGFGNTAIRCYPECFSQGTADVVVVEGDMPNIFGHVLLCGGDDYFHVAGPGGTSVLTLSSLGYRVYLSNSGKQELTRHVLAIPNPLGAQQRLEYRIANPSWDYHRLTHNCSHFVRDILHAGGVSDAWFSRFPIFMKG